MAVNNAPGTDRPFIDYFNMGPWIVYIGFTQDAKAFAKEQQRLGIPEAERSCILHDATTHVYECDGVMTIIITLRATEHPIEQVAGLLAHEATHAAQFLWERCGEREPGKEAEAYIVQYITQRCLYCVTDSRRAKRKRKVKK